MDEYKKIVKEVETALKDAPIIGAMSLEPKEGEAYSCPNCQEFKWDLDGCFTEWMEMYGYKKQPDMCPGYNPPKDGAFFLVAKSIKI